MKLKIAVSNLVISRIRQQDHIKYGRSHDIEQYKGRVIDMQSTHTGFRARWAIQHT